MKILTVLAGLSLMLSFTSCSESGFHGGATPQQSPSPTPSPSLDALSPTSPTPQSNPTPPPVVEQTSAAPTGISETTTSVTPDGIVEGQEVIEDCDRCLARARELSPQAGFTASMSTTVNLGFYKIEPSRNLCDIHFLADFSVPIDDHEGVDTVGNQQIILYCPCDCAWARDESSPDIGAGGGYNPGFGPPPDPTDGGPSVF